MKKLFNSFKYAFQGIFTSFKEEQNMKIHFLIIAIVIIFGFFLKISLLEWIICVFLFGFVISAELFNTAIEKTVDLAMPKIDPRAKIAKDVSAGAVLAKAISAAVIGLIIFLPKIIELFK